MIPVARSVPGNRLPLLPRDRGCRRSGEAGRQSPRRGVHGPSLGSLVKTAAVECCPPASDAEGAVVLNVKLLQEAGPAPWVKARTCLAGPAFLGRCVGALTAGFGLEAAVEPPRGMQ